MRTVLKLFQQIRDEFERDMYTYLFSSEARCKASGDVISVLKPSCCEAVFERFSFRCKGVTPGGSKCDIQSILLFFCESLWMLFMNLAQNLSADFQCVAQLLHKQFVCSYALYLFWRLKYSLY